MLRRRRPIAAAVALIAMLGAAVPAVAARTRSHPVAPLPAPWGTVLVRGADWAGSWAKRGNLDVHSNGDGNQDRLSQYGPAFECVELATRWAAIRYGDPVRWPAFSAYQMWDAGPALPVPFVQLGNGGALPPQFGDILVFGRSPGNRTGHVAVVAGAGPGYVDVVEQNWDSHRGRARLPIDRTTMPPRGGLPVIGWLRSITEMSGLWLLAGDGGVFPVGAARGYGSLGGDRLSRPVTGVAATPSGAGYWLVAADGGVFPFGDAQGYGSAVPQRPRRAVVGIAATPSGHGYWLAAADGRVYAFGDARTYRSVAGQLRRPVVGITATPSGNGYWLVASDGEVAAIGDAHWYGSTARLRSAGTIVGIAATASGAGYWLAGADGRVHAFGDAPALPAGPGPVTAIVRDPRSSGFWLISPGGGVVSAGGATTVAGLGGIHLNASVVAAAPL